MRTQTSQAEEYDVLVPGSGEAGKYIAWTLAKKEMGTGQVIQGWDEGVATSVKGSRKAVPVMTKQIRGMENKPNSGTDPFTACSSSDEHLFWFNRARPFGPGAGGGAGRDPRGPSALPNRSHGVDPSR